MDQRGAGGGRLKRSERQQWIKVSQWDSHSLLSVEQNEEMEGRTRDSLSLRFLSVSLDPSHFTFLCFFTSLFFLLLIHFCLFLSHLPSTLILLNNNIILSKLNPVSIDAGTQNLLLNQGHKVKVVTSLATKLTVAL